MKHGNDRSDGSNVNCILAWPTTSFYSVLPVQQKALSYSRTYLNLTWTHTRLFFAARFFGQQNNIKQLSVEDQTSTGGVTYYNALKKVFLFLPVFIFIQNNRNNTIWWCALKKKKKNKLRLISTFSSTVQTEFFCALAHKHAVASA